MFDNMGMAYVNTTLVQFLREHPGRKDKEWAEMFGVSRPHFAWIRTGKSAPSKEVMKRIEAATGGAVPILSWFAPPPPAKSEPRRRARA